MVVKVFRSLNSLIPQEPFVQVYRCEHNRFIPFGWSSAFEHFVVSSCSNANSHKE